MPRLVLPDDRPCPLKGVSVQLDALDFCARVRVQQTFVNPLDKPVNVRYVFMKTPRAAVTAVEARIGDRVIRGVVKEKEIARAEHKEAAEKGQKTFLVEGGADTLALNIANLPPKGECVVTLESTQAAVVKESLVSFAVPMVYVPKFTPKDSARPPAELEPLADRKPTYLIDAFAVAAFCANGVRSLTVEGVEGEAHVDGQAASLRSAGPTGCDHDLECVIGLAAPARAAFHAKPGAWLEPSAFGVSFQPALAAPDDDLAGKANTEIFFILDCSGSMRWGKGKAPIVQLRAAMGVLLRSLPSHVQFNVIRFGTDFRCLFPQAVPAAQDNVSRAIKYCRKMDADLGGTVLMNALQEATTQASQQNPARSTRHSTEGLALPSLAPGQTRQLFVLTDGAVSNTAQVIQYARLVSGSCRCFSFGVGEGASRELVEGIAEAGKGRAVFIKEGDNMAIKLAPQLHFALRPALSDISVEFLTDVAPPGAAAPQLVPFPCLTFPREVPPVFQGDSLTVGAYVPSPVDDASRPVVELLGSAGGVDNPVLARVRERFDATKGGRAAAAGADSETDGSDDDDDIASLPTHVRIRGRFGPAETNLLVPLGAMATPPDLAPLLQPFVAKLALDELESPISPFRAELSAADLSKATTVISVWGQVLASTTAFVGVDSAEPNTAPAELELAVPAPARLVREEAKLASKISFAMQAIDSTRYCLMDASPQSNATTFACGSPAGRRRSRGPFKLLARGKPKRQSRSSAKEKRTAPPRPEPLQDKTRSKKQQPPASLLERILQLPQTTSGLWTRLPDGLAAFFSSTARPAGVSDAHAWATALVIAYLERHERANAGVWSLLASRARRENAALAALVAQAAALLK